MDDSSSSVLPDIIPGVTDPVPVGRTPILYDPASPNASVEQAMLAVSDRFFSSHGKIVRVEERDQQIGPVLKPLSIEALRYALNETCYFYQWSEAGRDRELVRKSIPAPKTVVETLYGLGTWNAMKDVRSVAESPFIRNDGSVGGMRQEYDEMSGVWVAADTASEELEESPTAADVAKAVDALRDVVSEFPFRKDVDFAAFVAAILTVQAARMIRGHRPIFVITAPRSSSGKGLLLELISLIATGRSGGLDSFSENEEELRKKLTSFLLSGRPLLALDNVTGEFKSAALDRFVTAAVWQDRRLGGNEMVVVPNNAVVIATGNQVKIGGDTATRSLPIAIQPQCEQPAYRRFRRPDLLAYVRSRRESLALAGITILRAHIQAGLPNYDHYDVVGENGKKNLKPARALTRFESWSKIVRMAVIGAGLPDPVAGMDAEGYVSEEEVVMSDTLGTLSEWNPTWRGTAQSLVKEISDAAAEGCEMGKHLDRLLRRWALLGGGRDTDLANFLSTRFRQISGRWVRGLTVEVAEANGKKLRNREGMVWQLVQGGDVVQEV